MFGDVVDYVTVDHLSSIVWSPSWQFDWSGCRLIGHNFSSTERRQTELPQQTMLWAGLSSSGIQATYCLHYHRNFPEALFFLNDYDNQVMGPIFLDFPLSFTRTLTHTHTHTHTLPLALCSPQNFAFLFKSIIIVAFAIISSDAGSFLSSPTAFVFPGQRCADSREGIRLHIFWENADLSSTTES